MQALLLVAGKSSRHSEATHPGSDKFALHTEDQRERIELLEKENRRRARYEQAKHLLGDLASSLKVYFDHLDIIMLDNTEEDIMVLEEVLYTLKDEVLPKWGDDQKHVVRKLKYLYELTDDPGADWHERIKLCYEYVSDALFAYIAHTTALLEQTNVSNAKMSGSGNL